jgi:hypothetical protein
LQVTIAAESQYHIVGYKVKTTAAILVQGIHGSLAFTLDTLAIKHDA